MAVEKYFIKEGMKESQIEEFLRERFDKAGYSHIDIQRTPLGTRILVFAERPGLVIGKSGKRVSNITEEIRDKFGLENPMLDVKEVENPFLDAQVVASKIAKSIERGSFYKKVVNWYLSKIMESKAVGVEIRVAGKMAGRRGRLQTFKDGFIKHAGYYADHVVERGFAVATVKLGSIGVQVKILKELPDDLSYNIIEKVGEGSENERIEENEK